MKTFTVRAWVVGLVAAACLPAASARAQVGVVLAQTAVTASGERDLSVQTAFDVTLPDGTIEPREFRYTTPDNFATRAAGSVNLWFVLHGGGGNSTTMNRYFDVVPSTKPTVIVFPQALGLGIGGKTVWSNVNYAGTETDPDGYVDILFIEQLRSNLLGANPQLSAEHVYASGFSSGGALTWMLLCYRSSLFQGFGIYSMQLRKGRRDGGCGDGAIYDAAGNATPTGYETLTGTPPDLYG